jgi:hypothetical protein
VLSYASLVVGQGPMEGEFRDRRLPACQLKISRPRVLIDPPARRRGAGDLERVELATPVQGLREAEAPSARTDRGPRRTVEAATCSFP